MTHEELINLGFKLYGVEENDPFYRVTFKAPFKFNISHLSGVLNDGEFLLYDNHTKYTISSELENVIKVVGSELYYKIEK